MQTKAEQKQAKRIVITGASGVGKTSLASLLANQLALPLVPETARVICDRNGYENPTQIPDQLAFRSQVLDEQISAENAHQSFVADRGTIDCWALWQRWQICTAMTFDTEKYYERSRAQAASYTHVIYVPPLFKTSDDAFRWTDPDYIKQIDRLIRLTLIDWQLESKTYTLASADSQKRAQAILDWLAT